MILGGLPVSRTTIKELVMAFAALTDADIELLEARYGEAESDPAKADPLADVRLKLKRVKGVADRYIPYLVRALRERAPIAFTKSDSASMKSIVEKARAVLTDASIAEAAQQAFKRYCEDYDTSYKLTSV